MHIKEANCIGQVIPNVAKCTRKKKSVIIIKHNREHNLSAGYDGSYRAYLLKFDTAPC